MGTKRRVRSSLWMGRGGIQRPLCGAAPSRAPVAILPLFALLLALLAAPAAKGQTTIVSVTPTNGATGVPADSPVVFTFSARMDTESTLALFLAGSMPVLVTPSWSADGTRMTNAPDSPYPGSTTINWMVMGQSAAGVMLGGTTSGSFTTGSGGAVSPTIVSVSPPDASTDVPPTAPVVFAFSTNMNKAVSTVVFYNTVGSVVPVTPTWNAEGTRLTNTASPSFPVSSHITWFVSAQDTHGRLLAGTVAGGFMTGTGGGTAPTLVSVSPTNGAAGAAPTAPIFFTFSVAMNTNLTTAVFRESGSPVHVLPTSSMWTADRTMLMCTPSPGFPGGKVIAWTVQGQSASGQALGTAAGSFTTSVSGSEWAVFSALLSRGERVEQIEANAFSISGAEFVGLAGSVEGRGLSVRGPSQATQVLGSLGAVDAVECGALDSDPVTFAVRYPAGTYDLLVQRTGTVSSASVSLADGLLPATPRLVGWQDPPRVVLGQPLTLQWAGDAGGAAVDFVRVVVTRDGEVIFASPLPGSAGALNGASNSVTVPAAVFANAGRAEVSVSAFAFTGIETNAIPGVTLHGARHRTTAFGVRIVDGAAPPPMLRTTNLAGLAVGDPCLFVLRTTNGVRPFRFTLLGGALPPGLVLEPEGALSGQVGAAGTFDSQVLLTDLLGRSSTQSLRMVTGPAPQFVKPGLDNARPLGGGMIEFEVVGGAGADWVLERSTDLRSWSTQVASNSALNRVTLQLPLTGESGYFRARGLNGTLRPPNPRTVVPVLNTNVSASAEMGWPGGTLSLTNTGGYVFALQVPAGALRRWETITMTELSQVNGLPLSGGLRAAVDLKPEGLTFQNSARLDITAPAPFDPKTAVAFGALADGSQFALRPSFVTNQTTSQFLRHFSSAGVGEGTSGDTQSQAQQFLPDDPNSSAEQEAAAALQSCRADPDCDVNSDETKAQLSEIYVRMGDQVILPGLKAACGSDSDDVLDQALAKWREWAAQITSLGLVSDMDGGVADGALPDRMRRATAMASDAIYSGMTRACDQCRQHDLERMARVFRLAQVGELLGFGTEGRWVECVQKCLVYNLKIEAEITATSSSGTTRTMTKTEPKVTPANDSGEKFGESFTATGSWYIEACEPVEADCPVTVSPSSGTARIPTILVDLFKERTLSVPGIGSFVVYSYDPTLWVVLGAELGGTPAENMTIRCPEDPPQTIDRIFGPGFLAMHAKEMGSDQTGSMVFWLRNFDVGSGETLFTKEYQREEVTSKGPVKENTHIELRHTPQ